MHRYAFRAVAAALLFLGLFGGGGLEGAQLGDPAPALHISEWIKGGPVDLEEGKGKRVYVVEFWATWCPPCLDSIPHLTQLQRKWREQGVVFVGLTDEEPSVVKPFVDRMGGEMEYAVAIDRDDGTWAGYMEAFGQGAIPHAFVVDRLGRVVWHGHPMDELEETVRAVLAGTFDLERARKIASGRELFMKFYELAGSGRNEEETARLERELTTLDREVGGMFPGGRFDGARSRKEARFEFLAATYEEVALSGGEAARLEELARQIKAVAPKEFDFKRFSAGLELSRLFEAYYDAATEGKAAEAKELAKKMAATESDNVMVLNDAAWTMLTDEAIQEREPEAALALAKRAYDVTGGRSANVTDTYARALFDSGKKEEAIRYARKALAICDDAELRIELEKALKRYQGE